MKANLIFDLVDQINSQEWDSEQTKADVLEMHLCLERAIELGAKYGKSGRDFFQFILDKWYPQEQAA